MVEQSLQLDYLFAALADATRRDILSQIAGVGMSIDEIAEHYKLTFVAISKHIKVLERVNLVVRNRRGKVQVVTVVPSTLNVAREHIVRYAKMWDERFDQLEEILKEEQKPNPFGDW